MKEGIHPEYPEATITCACGAAHQTRSTTGAYTIDICSQCHPFYTGKQRMIDTAGRVEKFRRRFAKAEELKKKKAEAEAAKAAKLAAAAGGAEAAPE